MEAEISGSTASLTESEAPMFLRAAYTDRSADDALARQYAGVLDYVWRRLSFRGRLCVQRRYCYGHNVQMVAEDLGISPSTVRNELEMAHRLAVEYVNGRRS